jgi:hypothetical protein
MFFFFFFSTQKYMPRRKSGEEMNFTYVECLLYAFHHLAHKVVVSWFYIFQHTLACISSVMCILIFVVLKAPNATNSLCGYKIVTGQPSDRLGEDFSEFYTELTERWLFFFKFKSGFLTSFFWINWVVLVL